MSDLPSDTPQESFPATTRREIQKQLRGHLEYIQFLLEKFPGSPHEDAWLILKQDVARAAECMRKSG